MPSDLRQQVRRALEHPHLSAALTRFSEDYRLSRARAYEGVDFEALRERIAARKAEAAPRLDELAARFAAAATARGAQVARLHTPAEVRDYILGVARRHGARLVVKSKSMASEEVCLNAALEQAGIEVKETDLGEWIVQLARQRPSHMVLPAIHLTRDDVAELFSREVGERLQAEIPRLVRVAREQLREKFLLAGIGITGANIAVAETGSLVLFTNEGNARLVATLPPVHIALVGVEKLVERFDDIVPILTALPRSATAQQITSYVSILTGPAEAAEGGAKEMHIILYDHRRIEMSEDPLFCQALQCIRCASCLNVCPVYRLVGGHVFGKVYTGAIGTVLTACIEGWHASRGLEQLCIQCAACREVCPANIDLPELILEVRRRAADVAPLPVASRAALSIVSSRRAFHALLRAASLAQKPIAEGPFLRHLPLWLTEAGKNRRLPALADKPLRDRFPQLPQPRPGRRVAFFAGCLIDFVYPEVGEAVVSILNRAGIEVVFPEKQTCCGAPAHFSGTPEAAAANARDNVEAFSGAGCEAVISACPTCTAALCTDAPRLLRWQGEHDLAGRAEHLAAKTVDFSTFIRRLVEEGALRLPAGASLPPLTYHDSCHLKRTLHAEQPPRQLLRGAGYELREMQESDVCCGMGGSYSLKMPEVSSAMLARKLRMIAAAQAEGVALDCPGCLMQIRGGCAASDAPVRVHHTAEWLASLLEATD
jgi:L-lactate dehydrogenase complex protein LldF